MPVTMSRLRPGGSRGSFVLSVVDIREVVAGAGVCSFTPPNILPDANDLYFFITRFSADKQAIPAEKNGLVLSMVVRSLSS